MACRPGPFAGPQPVTASFACCADCAANEGGAVGAADASAPDAVDTPLKSICCASLGSHAIQTTRAASSHTLQSARPIVDVECRRPRDEARRWTIPAVQESN